ncbi:MAG: AMP-binding protein [Spirochaetaceae bacterium]|jgi:acetyl-CoA synthetase|nr:AMP-binding protein [Spirochaetaceae bacterium]
MALLDKYVTQTEFSSYEDFFNNFKINTPDNFNFAWDVMDSLAAEKPNERALVWCDEHGDEAVFSYADLKRLSDAAALAFSEMGIGKGSPVMLILKRRWEYWPLLLALHKLAAIAIPATHLLTAKDVIYRCKAADIKAIVCVDDERVIQHIDDSLPQLGTNAPQCAFVGAGFTPAPAANALVNKPWVDFKKMMAKYEGQTFNKPNPCNTNNDIMLLYFTSGTTGMPKMVRHNFRYPLGHIVTAKYWQQVLDGAATPYGGLHLTVADTGWAKAAWGKIYGQWLCGSAVFVYDYERFVPHEMLDVITRHKVTTFCAPPTIYRFFIKEDLSKYDFSSFKQFVVAGEPLNPEIYNQFKASTGFELREAYGQTELTVVMANWPWNEPKPGSMGKPAPNYHVDLVRDDGSSCGMGEEGQIVIYTAPQSSQAGEGSGKNGCRPDGMFDGYYRDAELTEKVWHDAIYYTGDMAWRDEDGYYWFIGRADDVIKSSGYRIGPFEVESCLLEHPSVLECAITAVPDPDRGAVVKATIVLVKGYVASEALKKELQEHVKTTTAPYKYPRIIEFVEELPKTISGKIRRVEIRGNK